MKPSQKTWFQTYTGKAFDFAEPRLEDICLEDIARALSNQCRFNGHCKKFYSVAEHSVRVARRVDELVEDDTDRWGRFIVSIRKWALLHDAAEAYTGDIPRPLKSMVLDDFAKFNLRLEDLIARKYDIEPVVVSSRDHPIRRADDEMLATEKAQLLAPPPRDWLPLPQPLDVHLDCWTPDRSYSEFMAEATARGIFDT